MRLKRKRLTTNSSKHISLPRLRFETLEDRRLLAITVDTLVDEFDGSIIDGDISLRDALAAATSGETIDFSITGTINLTLGELLIDKDLNIDGPGEDLLTIDASGNDPTPDLNNGDGSRVFLVEDNFGDIDVEIFDLTLTGGDSLDKGGAIRLRYENLTLSQVTITQNSTNDAGGAIGSNGGSLTIVQSTITGNHSNQSGGAIHTTSNMVITGSDISHNMSDGAAGAIESHFMATISNTTIQENISQGKGAAVKSLGSFMVDGSTISGNRAYNSGGAFFTSGNLTITNSAVDNNYSHNKGGGIYGDHLSETTITGSTISSNSSNQSGGGIAIQQGEFTLRDSTVTGNHSLGLGGGIRNSEGILTVENSTISNNSSVWSEGGGIWNFLATTTLKQTTISGNSARKSGGGIYSLGGAQQILHSTITQNTADFDNNSTGTGGGIFGPAVLKHSIVAINQRGLVSRDDIAGSVNAKYTIIGDNTGATINDNGGNQIGTSAAPIDPLLGPLADNGGLTQTHALLPNSSALDRGDPLISMPATNDQRGVPYSRIADGDSIVGAVVDIGAYEAQIAPSADFNNNLFVDGLDFLAWQRNFGKTTGATKSDGNSDDDADVDSSDLAAWESSFGSVISLPSLADSTTEVDLLPQEAPQTAIAVEVTSANHSIVEVKTFNAFPANLVELLSSATLRQNSLHSVPTTELIKNISFDQVYAIPLNSVDPLSSASTFWNTVSEFHKRYSPSTNTDEAFAALAEEELFTSLLP